jgi:hypothetical protein
MQYTSTFCHLNKTSSRNSFPTATRGFKSCIMLTHIAGRGLLYLSEDQMESYCIIVTFEDNLLDIRPSARVPSQ